MGKIPCIYFDAASFIDFVKFEAGQINDSARQRDCWHLQQLLQASRDRQIDLYTSIVTVAECRPEKNETKRELMGRFDALLTSGQYVKLVQPSIRIARAARDLNHDYGINLRSVDSIHIASAIDRQCIEFFTTDANMKKQSVRKALKKLGMSVIAGEETQVLPDSYRQSAFETFDKQVKH